MTYHSKKMLVTGGAGFIGANFIYHWQAQHPETVIFNLDLLTYASHLDHLKNLPHPAQHVFIHGDIVDQALVEKILREHKIDTIVHFAAESHVDNSIKNPGIFVKTNVLGTQTLLAAAKTVWLDERNWDARDCRFHHVSTDEVYGSLDRAAPAFTEEHTYFPNSPYSASKAASDHLVRAYHHTYQLPVTISNCSNNYGRFQHAEKLIPTIIRCCLEEKNIPVYGDGSNIRDWLFVDDHCAAVDAILHKGRVGETYNIGGNNEVDNLTLVRLICRLIDEYRPQSFLHETLIRFVTDRKGHDWRYAINNNKICSELKWQPAQDFDRCLRNTICFYLDTLDATIMG